MPVPASPADARIAIMVTLKDLFMDLLSGDDDLDTDLTPKEVAVIEQLADEMSLEFLDVLGLDVVSVEEDGSILARLSLEESL